MNGSAYYSVYVYHITHNWQVKQNYELRAGIGCETLESLLSYQNININRQFLNNPMSNYLQSSMLILRTRSRIMYPLRHQQLYHLFNQMFHIQIASRLKVLFISSCEPHAISLGSLRAFETISMWNLHFDWNASVTAFISRIEDLRLARGLVKSSSYFISVWFRATKSSDRNWEDLTKKLTQVLSAYQI